ncbi:sigma-70 family RNA polymerase sigma factor [Devosia algicola]|uniref:Sigma-70 family RNA polymerase sigma factor n=1 Tax=Devosia algicola TaxID=3026418 RepID=A0ABY7YL57_9HYPH|nr:sigma-70 family RNA polymerase sigma factor [Devosia algicola]WDR01922.1 sigma-70 family RNA polymerase sigma factor [Devosia algicola]
MITDDKFAAFEAERRRLAALAYRMTGSVADTEDMLQQAWIRFAGQDITVIDNVAAWLRSVVMRLCLDHLTSARARRETYVGAWLPEPLVQERAPSPEDQWMVAEDVTMALMLTLQTLSPEMRAAFILRDAFDHSFDEISAIVGRSPTACRQLVSRARRRLCWRRATGAKAARGGPPLDDGLLAGKPHGGHAGAA